MWMGMGDTDVDVDVVQCCSGALLRCRALFGPLMC